MVFISRTKDQLKEASGISEKMNGSSRRNQGEERIILRRKLQDIYTQGKRNPGSRSHEKQHRVIHLSKTKPTKEFQARNYKRTRAQVKHFSHRHPLGPFEVEEEDGIICSACELGLLGSAYGCLWCNFFLHKSCFELPKELLHRSHPKHKLTLLPIPPYKETGVFGCNACGDYGGGFVYHCSICNFDLHVDCAYLSRKMDCERHQHPLTLFYSFPYKNEAGIFCCDICDAEVDKKEWIYYCQDCDYGIHVDCATVDLDDEDNNDEERDDEDEEEDTDDEPERSISATRNRMGGLHV